MTEKKVWLITQDVFADMVRSDDGICLECGSLVAGCEPDASGRECENCGEEAGCGAEEALIQGNLRMEDGPFEDLPEGRRVKW